MTPTLLIADSGSTKTDWCLIKNGRRRYFQTQGINPYFQTEQDIEHILRTELPVKQSPDAIHFYGAGIQSEDRKKSITQTLSRYFGIRSVHGYSDMLASARATCGHEAGIACIMGTGSNTCFFNGKKITFKTPSLGYVLGDEGGGTALGRKVLQYHLHDIFEKDLQQEFSAQFGQTRDEILDRLYRQPFPNRYLAQFARFIFTQRGHYMIENIAEDVLNDLFIHHLLRYPKVHQHTVHFTGSVAWHLRDILENLCAQYEITAGTFLQKPIQGLAAFHLAEQEVKAGRRKPR